MCSTVWSDSAERIFLPGTKLMCGYVAMCSLFGAIRLRSELSLTVYVFVNLCLVFAYAGLIPAAQMMTKIFEYSQQFKTRHTKRLGIGFGESREEVLMTGKSLPVIRCGIGKLYYMEAQAKLTMVDWLLNGTIFLFLNF